MCDMKGYSVIFGSDKVWIEPHFCRCPDCGGGMTLDEACEIVAQHFEEEAKAMRDKTHIMVIEYVE